jgi:hypothetical protein
MSGDRTRPPAGARDQSGGDLDKAFALLKTIRAYKNSRFPFLRTRVDYDLLLHIGHGQVGGRPMNLTDILTSNIGTVSTIVRRLGRLEKLGVVHKVKAETDKRNVHYFLADEHLDAVAEFVVYLSRAGDWTHGIDLSAEPPPPP